MMQAQRSAMTVLVSRNDEEEEEEEESRTGMVSTFKHSHFWDSVDEFGIHNMGFWRVGYNLGLKIKLLLRKQSLK